MFTLQNRKLCCQFDDAGTLVELRHDGLELSLSGLHFDFGCQEKMALGLLEYESMLEFRTWNLPDIRPTGKKFDRTPFSVEVNGNTLIAHYRLAQTDVDLTYTLCDDHLKADLRILNTCEEKLYLNACAFLLGLRATNDVTFDFPGNAPISHFDPAELAEREVIQTGLVNFAVHTKTPCGDLNVLFLDPIEKWGCGVYREGEQTNFVYNAALEMDLCPGKCCEVGTMYLLPRSQAEENPYRMIRDLVERLGYHATTQGIHDGVMYSCHPAGTMDAGFPRKDDLFQYAQGLPMLKKMGIDHVWLLPVFEHNENGVYHSNDQSVIDPRYGGEDACRYYCDKAHDLGMTILFDYVPHGPAPQFPVATENPEWPSKRRDGSLQDEWQCVSMDYNHPGYQEYTAQLVHDHVKRFGVDGARIDCAMGGLSNWRPYRDNRPSGNSVLAGVHITQAIREGFLRGGKQSFILPENFNLIPNYYHCTDLFYGMNLYRAFVELEQTLKTDPASYVARLTDFLEREAWVTPPQLHKLRFLGNHDTVSWVWQSARAVDCYGVGAAKALWAVISLIDGVPMLYQGDENPALYGREGENLTPYFTRLFADRKKYLPKGNLTTYLHTETPVMAFIREPDDAEPSRYENHGSGRVLVLINLSREEQPFPIADHLTLLTDSCDQTDAAAPLAPFAYRLLRFEQ